MNAEQERLNSDRINPRDGHEWKQWGPYLSERQWGTVREDYSAAGQAWQHVTHDHSRSLTYRWGEDGIAGFCDDEQWLCFAMAFWNGKDKIIKERLFGLSGPEGNHGEDVKECYYYLDGTPTNSYLKMLYKYPQCKFPYEELIAKNAAADRSQPEFELHDTGCFNENRYFDIVIEYAKAAPQDFLIRITARNLGPEPAPLHILPHLWFRNTWSWGRKHFGKPTICMGNAGHAQVSHPVLGNFEFHCQGSRISPNFLFCNNETNTKKLYGDARDKGYFKDAINDYVVDGHTKAVNPDQTGTKVAACYSSVIPAGDSQQFCLRLRHVDAGAADPFHDFDSVFAERVHEANEFYDGLQSEIDDPDARLVQRQAYAGLIGVSSFTILKCKSGLTETRLTRNRRTNGLRDVTANGHI